MDATNSEWINIVCTADDAAMLSRVSNWNDTERRRIYAECNDGEKTYKNGNNWTKTCLMNYNYVAGGCGGLLLLLDFMAWLRCDDDDPIIPV